MTYFFDFYVPFVTIVTSNCKENDDNDDDEDSGGDDNNRNNNR